MSSEGEVQGRAYYSELNMEAYNMESHDEGNGWWFGAHMHMSAAEDVQMEEDALMMDRPFLNYIMEMLSDEAMEDRAFLQNDCMSYQAILNGFYDIIDDHSDGNLHPPASNSDNVGLNDSIHEHSEPIQSAYTGDNTSLYDIIGEHSVPSGDVSLYGIDGEHSVYVRSSSNIDKLSFYDGIGELSAPICTSSHTVGPSAPTRNSCSSDELCRVELLDKTISFNEAIGVQSVLIESSSDSDKFHFLSSNSYSNDELFQDVDAIYDKNIWIDQILQSNPSTPLSTTHRNSSDVHISFVKNKDLNVEADYEKLYANKDESISHGSYAKDKRCNGSAESNQHKQHNGHADDKCRSSHVDDKPHNGRVDASGKKGATAGAPQPGMPGKKKGKSDGKLELGAAGLVDLKELLVTCAQAVATGDRQRAAHMLQELQKSGASPSGSGLQRLIYYFSEALKARMNGKGSLVYNKVASENQPSTAKLLKAFRTCFSFIPYFKISYYFANQSILKVAKGATCLHIVDYGMLYGLQWPCLINALADRKEGPPKLVITGVEFQQPGPNPTEGLEDIGRRLAEYAKTYNVPFEFRPIAASNWEDVNPVSHNTGYGPEVLVVNCMNRLRHVLDECVNASSSSTSSPRQKLLDKMHNLNPDLFVVSVLNATYNTPFFVPRFREALNFYSNKFDMVETTWDESIERMTMERDCMYYDVLNVVACEGMERVQRPESYKQWQARIRRTGFEHVPIMPTVLSRSRSHVQALYHKDFNVDHDSNCWMLLGWKGRIGHAVSAWKPRRS